MSARRRQSSRRGLRALGCLVSAAAWLWASGPSARAEDDRVEEESPAVAPQGPQAFQLNLGEQFVGHVRRDLVGPVSTAGGCRLPEGGDDRALVTATVACLRTLGESRLASVEAVCGLSPSQRRRLQVAVNSEIGQMVDELEAAHAKYAGAIVEIDRRNPASQRPMQDFQRDIQQLIQRRRNLLGGDSMFAKTLPTTLDGDQLARLTAATEARRDRRWRAIVAGFLEGIDNSLGLDQRQYDVLERLLLEKRPPLRVDVAIAPNARHNHQTEQMLAMCALSEVDGQRLQATLRERQWKTLTPWREQGARLRSHVEGAGILEQVPE